MFKLDFEKAEEPEIKLPTSRGSSKKEKKQKQKQNREFQKNIYFCNSYYWTWNNRTTDWFQTGKEVYLGCILLPSVLTYMHNTSCEMLGWMKHKLESRLPREMSISSDM